jgi:hypothetical protein
VPLTASAMPLIRPVAVAGAVVLAGAVAFSRDFFEKKKSAKNSIQIAEYAGLR